MILATADAVLNGKTVKIPNEDVTDGGPPDLCYSFHARPAHESAKDRETNILNTIAEGVTFLIADGFQSTGGYGYGTNGSTRSLRTRRGKHMVHSGARIKLAWQNLIPLVREDTTPSEKVVQQVFIGKTVS